MTAVILWALCSLVILIWCGRECQWDPDAQDYFMAIGLCVLAPFVLAVVLFGCVFAAVCWLVRRVTA